jgi:hypothetical protein
VKRNGERGVGNGGKYVERERSCGRQVFVIR